MEFRAGKIIKLHDAIEEVIDKGMYINIQSKKEITIEGVFTKKQIIEIAKLLKQWR